MRKNQIGKVGLLAREKDASGALKCDHYFRELHQSAAEALPEDVACGAAHDPWQEDLAYASRSPPLAVSCMCAHAGLAVRYLQHCRLTDLYWQFQAEWGVLSHQPELGDVPSYDTFRRRYRSSWEKVLKMRKSSQHKQCNLCFGLQAVLHSAKASKRWKRRRP